MAKTKVVVCTRCNGSGYKDASACEYCDGAGEVMFVNVTTKCPECDGFGCDYCDEQGYLSGWQKD
jgi:DnaJ-class molecular chaperone